MHLLTEKKLNKYMFIKLYKIKIYFEKTQIIDKYTFWYFIQFLNVA